MVVWNDLSNTQWLDYPSQSNILRRTYVNGFLDVSQNIVGRKDLELKGNITITGQEGYKWNAYGQVLSGNFEGSIFNSVYFGRSVQMDVSGLTIVVGANDQDIANTPYDANNPYPNQGAVTVYRYDTTAEIWYQLGNTIYGQTNNGDFGYHVDINDAGTRIIASDIGANLINVYDYDSSNNMWDIQTSITGHTLSLSNTPALSGNGNTIVFGNYTEGDDYNGKQYVYRNTSETTWTKIGEFTGSHIGAHLGYGISISYDGNRITVNESDYNINTVYDTGRIAIYEYSGTLFSWNLLGDWFYGETTNDRCGAVASLSKDGSIVAFLESVVARDVQVYQYDATGTGSWKQLGTTLHGDSDNNFGTGIRLSDDGTTLAVSSNDVSNPSIYVYKYTNGDWVQQGSIIVPASIPSSSGDFAINQALAITGDGTKIVAGKWGAISNNRSGGAVQSWQWSKKEKSYPSNNNTGELTILGDAAENPDNWEVTNVTTFSDGTDNYGSNMKFNANGTIMVVGEQSYNSSAGRIHAYKYRNGNWNKMGSDVADSNITYVGFSLGINDSGFIIGTGSGETTGGVIVWEFINGDWSVKGGEISNGSITKFGVRGISFNGEGNIVAARGDNGAAVYQYNSGTWNQLGTNFTGINTDADRTSIALNQAGNIVAIGDSKYDSHATDAGRVGIFQYNSGTTSWDQLGDWITPPSTTKNGDGDHYGISVSLSSDGYIVAFGVATGEGANLPSHAAISYRARIFQYVPSAGQWVPRSPDVKKRGVTSAISAGLKVGNHTALSGDGNTLVVNDQDAESASGVYGGAVHVFKYIDGLYKWVTRLDGPTDTSVYLGANGVAISRDGTRFGGSREGSDYVRIGTIVNNPHFKITNGNVGIGTTSGIPKLDVNGAVFLRNENLTFASGGGGGDTTEDAALVFNQGLSNRTLALKTDTDANLYGTYGGGGGRGTSWRLGGNGTSYFQNYVGIGTDTPNRSLTMYHSSAPALQLINPSTGTAQTDGMVLEQYLLDTYFTNKEQGHIYFRTHGDTVRMVLYHWSDFMMQGPYGKITTNNAQVSWTTSDYGTAAMRWQCIGSHSANGTNYWDLQMWKAGAFYFSYKNGHRGYVSNSGSNIKMNFTGQHRSYIEEIPFSEGEQYIGLIACANKNTYINVEDEPVYGKEAITINESLPLVSLCKKEKDKSCFGVISQVEDNNETQREYSLGTFVSLFGKQYGDNRFYINSVGEGALWVSNKNGNLESGDYITTSSVSGYGEKQDDDILHNYTVAKITMDCDFNPQLKQKKRILRRVIDFTFDISSNSYYDVSGNGKIFTKPSFNEDKTNKTDEYKNPHYTMTVDSSYNLIDARQNVLDVNGEIQWEDTTEQERAYKIRHVDPSGNILTEEEYNTKIASGEEAYIAAFVGCTYHCG